MNELSTKLAQRPDSDFGWSKGKANARQLGYSDTWLRRLPDIVWESAAAVGNPFKLGEIVPGQTVLDVGCGAGADACVAALHVGSTGKVIGVDCTPAMIDKARKMPGMPHWIISSSIRLILPICLLLITPLTLLSLTGRLILLKIKPGCSRN